MRATVRRAATGLLLSAALGGRAAPGRAERHGGPDHGRRSARGARTGLIPMSTLDGAVRARISNEMVGLHTEYYGRGPTTAKVHADGGASRTDMTAFEKAGEEPEARD